MAASAKDYLYLTNFELPDQDLCRDMQQRCLLYLHSATQMTQSQNNGRHHYAFEPSAHITPPLTGFCMLEQRSCSFSNVSLTKIFLSELTLVGLNANRLRQAKTDSDSLLYFSRILPGLYNLCQHYILQFSKCFSPIGSVQVSEQ